MGDKMDSRKIGMIAFAVIAMVIAGIVIFKSVTGEQVQVVKTVDGGTGTNPKVLFMKAQKDAADKGAVVPEKDPNAVGDKSQ